MTRTEYLAPTGASRRLPSLLRQLPAVLEPERVAILADQARVRFMPPCDPQRVNSDR